MKNVIISLRQFRTLRMTKMIKNQAVTRNKQHRAERAKFERHNI